MPIFPSERNRVEFLDIHGFDPREIDWEPQTTLHDLRDNRDPGELGRALVGKVKRWPTTGVLTHAKRVLG